MLDEAALRRLAEMGIDVYRPRAQPAPAGAGSAASDNGAATVYLLAEQADHPLLQALSCTFTLAGVGAVVARAQAGTDLAGARALVAFGAAQARAVGGLLSARQQAAIGWVATGELAQLRGDALAKRALWGELKRLLRQLRD